MSPNKGNICIINKRCVTWWLYQWQIHPFKYNKFFSVVLLSNVWLSFGSIVTVFPLSVPLAKVSIAHQVSRVVVNRIGP